MSSFPLRCLALAIALVGAMEGCRKSEHYCPGAPLDNCNYLDAAGSCASNDHCSEPAPVHALVWSGAMHCTHVLDPPVSHTAAGSLQWSLLAHDPAASRSLQLSSGAPGQ
jgi:hypothetical protein